jgi:addiction module HigA family antidote
MISEIQNQYKPDLVSPPGETLQETLEAMGMSQAELAQRTGRPKKTINEIIKGKAAISPETALQLERVLGVPATFWNSRERHYREDLARVAEQERLKEQVAWLTKIPVKAMSKMGWIKLEKDQVQQLLEVLNFFGVASPQELETFWERQAVKFRMSPSVALNHWAALTWLRKGEMEAKLVKCSPYNPQTFKQALQQIRSLTTEDPDIFYPRMVSLCADAGVALVFIPEIPSLRVSGATRWLTPAKAMIQLNLRYKTDDHLWFTFFHEAGHILKHDKRLTFIEEIPDGGRPLELSAGDLEEEANRFAANFLIPAESYRRLVKKRTFSKEAVKLFAQETGVAPGIVVGRLQHDSLLPYTHLNDLKRRFEWVH